MSTNFRGVSITAANVIFHIEAYDRQYAHTNDYDNWLDKGNFKYAIRYEGKLYPCKHILSRTTGISAKKFGGGEQTNRVFRELGFRVIDKP